MPVVQDDKIIRIDKKDMNYNDLYSPLLQNVQRMLNRNFVCQGGGGKHTDVW